MVRSVLLNETWLSGGYWNTGDMSIGNLRDILETGAKPNQLRGYLDVLNVFDLPTTSCQAARDGRYCKIDHTNAGDY
jgi:hypothetical protein